MENDTFSYSNGLLSFFKDTSYFSLTDFSFKVQHIIIKKNVDVVLKIDSCSDVILDINQEDFSSLTLKILAYGIAKRVNVLDTLKQGASVKTFFADFCDGQENIEARFVLDGQSSKCIYKMACFAANDDQKNIDVSISHLGRNTFGIAECYGVTKDRSKLVFSGTSHVFKGAKNSNTRQNSRIMVFDKNSNGLCKPILKIDEKDIKASHGASLGKVNDEHLFYLMSRGLSESDAKKMIISGYLNPIIDGFKSDGDYEKVLELIGGRL